MASQTIDSAVGLRRHDVLGGNAGTRTQLSRWRLLYRQPRCLNRQRSRMFPWGDRRDSHPLTRGSRPRASTTSASITVRLEGIAPSPLAYQASARLSCYRRVITSLDDRSCTDGLEVPNPALCVAELHPGKKPCQMAGNDPAAVTPHGGPDRSGDRSRRSTPPAIRTLLLGFGIQSRPRRRRITEHHRKDSNLHQRPSQRRVPIHGSMACEPRRSRRDTSVRVAGIAPAASW